MFGRLWRQRRLILLNCIVAYFVSVTNPGLLAPFSNRGANLGVTAPGVGILSAMPGNYGSPSLAYAPTGFRAGVGEETGGWYVLWTNLGDAGDSTLLGRRVALQDGMPTDPAPFSATSGLSAPITHGPMANARFVGQVRRRWTAATLSATAGVRAAVARDRARTARSR